MLHCKLSQHVYLFLQAVMDGAAEVAGLDQVKAWIFAGHSMASLCLPYGTKYETCLSETLPCILSK